MTRGRTCIALAGLLTASVGVLFVACQRTPSQAEGAELLVGQYSLFVGSGDQTPQSKLLKQETLRLNADATIDQDCEFSDREQFHHSGGKWSYDNGHVWLEDIRDCGGFLHAYGEDRNASLIVEFSTPPVILLDPDTSVMYERRSPQP